jgi:hypothetical protein
MSDMGKDIKPRTQNKNHQTIKQKPLYSRAKNTNKETKENKNEEINTRENYHETGTTINRQRHKDQQGENPINYRRECRPSGNTSFQRYTHKTTKRWKTTEEDTLKQCRKQQNRQDTQN